MRICGDILKKKLKEKTRLDASKETLINDVVVPDTSVIVRGVVSKKLIDSEIFFKKILIHEAVMAELESQANKGRESGYLGLDEIKKIRELSYEKGFVLDFVGNRPGDFEIKFAKSGEIDSLIRDLSIKEGATLLTADLVQGKVSLAKGLSVIIYDVDSGFDGSLLIERFFVEGAMSVHLREGCLAKAKVGKPGAWSYESVSDEVLSKEFLEQVYLEILEFVKLDEQSFFESDKKSNSVIQLKDMRVVVVKPPFSDFFEITAVRPVFKSTLDNYDLSPDLEMRLFEKAEGLLVAGPPGHGKSTFVQALADKYVGLNRAVKTLESPRDLVVDKSVSRYGSSQAHYSDIRDVLLLSRPDFVLFDEVRNVEDFKLFGDLRLSGIGMLGVIHAAVPIDAIQRFLGRLELGVIPHVVDTVVFVFGGKIDKVFSVSLSVKVPSGMVEADLARPVILINDFFTGKLEYEIYSYGEEAIVVPINSFSEKKSVYLLAEKQLREEFAKLNAGDVCVEFISDNKCAVYVSKDKVSEVIGPRGGNISSIQKKFKLKIDVFEKKSLKTHEGDKVINFNSNIINNCVVFDLDRLASDVLVSLYVDDVFLMNVKSSKKGQIKVSVTSPHGKILKDALGTDNKVKICFAQKN